MFVHEVNLTAGLFRGHIAGCAEDTTGLRVGAELRPARSAAALGSDYADILGLVSEENEIGVASWAGKGGSGMFCWFMRSLQREAHHFLCFSEALARGKEALPGNARLGLEVVDMRE
jgi:hypothetical protein